MKKKLVCLLLILIICFPTNLALAADNIVDVDTGKSVNALTTYVVTTGSEDEISTFKSYKITIPGDTKEIILPITFDKKGVFYSSASLNEETSHMYLDETIYKEEACTNSIPYHSYDKQAAIPESGTYYIKLKISDYRSDEKPENYEVNFTSQFYSGGDQTLEFNKWACYGNDNTSEPMYYKVDVKKTGCLEVNIEADLTDVTLLDRNKKALSEEVYCNKEKGVFVVNKGTYYLKVDSYSEIYRIKIAFNSLTKKSGSSKQKAINLVAGKTYSGYITATDKTGSAGWYKIVLKKSQKVTVKLTGSVSSGGIAYEFSGGNISGTITGHLYSVNDDESFSPKTWTSDKLPKGTYYIKVFKDDKNASGFYNIGLKK